MRPRRNPGNVGRPRKVLALTIATTALSAGLGVQPAAATSSTTDQVTATRRVDLVKPTFRHPTRITNPLFPTRRIDQLLQLGAEEDDKLRFETTRLRDTKTIRWDSKNIKTVVVEFVAYTNGRIAEVAFDYYAQADDGAVWYFGEQVNNYVNGVIDNHDGTWLAGRDGPPGMIMPAHPRIGDVFRPENIPGLVFEEVTITATGATVPGPRGRVAGAVRTQARLMDGSVEEKIFAPRYGEFRAAVPASGELYEVAVAIPTDRLHRPMPRRLKAISTGADKIFTSAAHCNWRTIHRQIRQLNATWTEHQRQVPVPPHLASQLTNTLRALSTAVATRNRATIQQAAVNVETAGVDAQSQYRSVRTTDKARIAVWRHQLQVDRLSPALVAGDKAVLAAIKHRRHN